MSTYPAYLELYNSGELQKRVNLALEELQQCRVCPRNCDVNRLENKFAVCKSGRYAKVSSYFPHRGEEDILRGWNGSGTIFFSFCNLKCVFCQNYDISWEGAGEEVSPERLAMMMIELQAEGCHNINFVTPEHVVPQIIEALPIAVKKGLKLPLVYNTSGYDSIRSLELLDGIIDIYMPDFKFWNSETSRELSRAKNYPEAVRKSIKEMHRQVGDLQIDLNGLAKRGVLLRHLVMPNGLADTREVMNFIVNEISPDTYVNIMDQYYPAGRVNAERFSQINRRVSLHEYEEAVRIAKEEGIHRLDQRLPVKFNFMR